MYVVYREKKIVYVGSDAAEATNAFINPVVGDAIHRIESIDELNNSWKQIHNKLSVKDEIQWTSQGTDMFATPRPVSKISDDGKYVWVEGSDTAVPVDQTTIVKKHSDFKTVETIIQVADDLVNSVSAKLLTAATNSLVKRFDKLKIDKIKKVLGSIKEYVVND
jgi:hypothetical protein